MSHQVFVHSPFGEEVEKEEEEKEKECLFPHPFYRRKKEKKKNLLELFFWFEIPNNTENVKAFEVIFENFFIMQILS